MVSVNGANPIFFTKKNKDWTSRTVANPPTPLRPILSHFCLHPPPPTHRPQSERHMCITPNITANV